MKDNARFRDKVVIITGSSSGIGRATALAFAREGANTILASRSREKLEKVAEEVRKFGPGALVVPTDVSLQDEVHNMVWKGPWKSMGGLTSSLTTPEEHSWEE
jgi:NAD(P)-dependent dehydrogenase (short-subunit alcohol dehydrogenase family)